MEKVGGGRNLQLTHSAHSSHTGIFCFVFSLIITQATVYKEQVKRGESSWRWGTTGNWFIILCIISSHTQSHTGTLGRVISFSLTCLWLPILFRSRSKMIFPWTKEREMWSVLLFNYLVDLCCFQFLYNQATRKIKKMFIATQKVWRVLRESLAPRHTQCRPFSSFFFDLSIFLNDLSAVSIRYWVEAGDDPYWW